MKKSLRLLCLLFAAIISVSAISCSGAGKKEKQEETSEIALSTTAETLTAEIEPINPELEELDYGETVVTFLTRSSYYPSAANEICVEDLNNDPVNDAIYNRNLFVEDLLNVKIRETSGSIGELVRRDISSGNGEYDIIADSVCDGPALIMDGLYYNLLDNGIDTYLDITKPWWSQKWLEENMTGDRLYCITGSLALTLKRFLYVTYYNKSMAEANGIESLYDVVERGDWTIDYLSELIPSLYIDLNGNSEADEEDSYGLLINHYACVDMFWSCFDMDYFSKDSDGWFYMNSDQEKLSVAIEKVYKLVRQNKGNYDFIDSYGVETACKMFAQGQSLLASLELKWAESSYLRNMGDTYGMLPEPKYDTDQKNYYTYAHDQYTVFFVPITVKDPELCGAVLEAMSYESYRTLDPAYFNLALKGRYANDQETRRMLDIIIDGFVVDASWVYGKTLGLPAAQIFRTPIYDGDLSIFSSNYAKYARSVPIGLREIRKKIESFDY